MTASLDTLSAGVFAPLVGKAFGLHGPDGHGLAVTLAHCDEHPRATMPGSARTAFSLTFVGPADEASPGGECVLSHPSLGTVGPLYLARVMPIGFPPGSAVYEAVFA
ncbi:hypothetical protein SAMN04487843_106269 [Methylobacterium sp. ap11]|uniref:DUF6916 family protein n=1 Tax=Methylobacterium sp. ap11 TaxID=1761799 RepID=UPI0008CC4A26|nr:hypothetical protein [Methylobacterium sp. ap11]SEP08374.1 hypothetical protein SAMN04487843_106269 [Methylobacterium sp. ap11]